MLCWIIAGLSLAMFCASLFLPAVRFVYAPGRETQRVDTGLMCLAFGWTGLFVGSIAWLANPAYFLGLILLGMQQTSATTWLSVAWLLGLSTTIQMVLPFTGDEAGISRKLIVPQAGFYVWMLSLTLAVVSLWP
jgi:hypothetical protein